MGTEEIPLFLPVILSVSDSISRRTSSKSVYFFPFWCRNSAHSGIHLKIKIKVGDGDCMALEITDMSMVTHRGIVCVCVCVCVKFMYLL